MRGIPKWPSSTSGFAAKAAAATIGGATTDAVVVGTTDAVVAATISVVATDAAMVAATA